MKKDYLSLLLAAALILPGTLRSADLGDPAAKLAIAEWIKGKPVEVTDGKNIYVVEFWATWCPPCRASIPHLTELQKKFAGKGVVFVGISDEKAEVVKPFVEKMGGQMDYRVAIDAGEKTSEGYMKAFGVEGIPHAFIVDKAGKVIWQGHPMADLDRTLQQIIEGKYDLKMARKKAEAMKLIEQFAEAVAEDKDEAKTAELGKKIEAIDREAGGLLPDGKPFRAEELRKEIKFQSLIEKYGEALAEDSAKAAKLEAQIKAVAPPEFKVEDFKQDLKLQQDFGEYYDLVSRLPDKEKAAQLGKQIAATGSKNPVLLNELAWAVLTDKRIKERDLDLALTLSAKAVDLTKGTNASIIDTHARALFDAGKKAEAAAQQKKAIELTQDKDQRENLEKTLKAYEK